MALWRASLSPCRKAAYLKQALTCRIRSANVITKPAKAGQLHYSFETEALRGVKKNTPYKVQLKLLEANTGKELALVEQVFKSDVDQATLPTKAPVVGPGYQANPEL